jgi:hypothetical protein
MRTQVYHTVLLSGFLLLAGCQSSETTKQSGDTVAEQSQPANLKTDSTDAQSGRLPYEAVYNEQTQQIDIQADKQAGVPDIDQVILAMNKKYPNILMEKLQQKGDTLFVRIPDATALTQEMGTMGANIYLAEGTYSLTNIPGIRVVFFDFAEGDHAVPGAYTRDSFKDIH